MYNRKQIRKILWQQKLMKFYAKMIIRKANKHSKERFVTTSHGDIRVREYGFESDQVKPLFIDLHGGGFVVGCPELDDHMCRYFAEKAGVKIISIDYPKAPDYKFPIGLNATYEVIEHYMANSEKYKFDKNCVGIGGHSAGANFTAVMCMMAKESGDFSFKYQILDYPPMDMFIDPATKPYPKGAVPLKDCIMYNICYYDNDPETAKNSYLSPVFATPEQLAAQPPTLLIVAGMDSLHDEGVRYGEMLKAAGIPLEFHDFKNAAHGFTLKESEDSTKAQNIMAEFIAKHSK